MSKTLYKISQLAGCHTVYYPSHCCNPQLDPDIFPFLQEINGDAFKHLKILVELNLSHNNITHIEKGTFRGNDRLQTLNLAGNQVGQWRLCKI